jgi:hypothetical protein
MSLMLNVTTRNSRDSDHAGGGARKYSLLE